MRASTSLFLRGLLSKLHPPSPATPRESQQLLRLLDTSFRQRLDELHPHPRSASQNGTPDNQIPLDTSRNANAYLDSVLHHPLLESNTSAAELASSLRSQAVQAFEKALRNESVDLHFLRGCCRKYARGIERGESISSDRLLGVKIAAWLFSASDRVKISFLTDRAVLEAIPLMYADGLEEVVWEWLSILYKNFRSDGGPATAVIQRLGAEDRFVSAMMGVSTLRGALEDAAQQFIKASEYRFTSCRGRVREDEKASELGYRPLALSWARISRAILYKGNMHGISEDMFDRLLGFAVPFSWNPSVTKGFVMLYHPTKPSVQTLFQEFQSQTFKQSWSAWCQNLNTSKQRATLLTILDAADLALRQQNPSQSQFFLDLAQAQWPQILPSPATSKPAERLARAREEVETQIPFNPGFALT
jgi:hypothetical protein